MWKTLCKFGWAVMKILTAVVAAVEASKEVVKKAREWIRRTCPENT